jgi:hypothetical protein
MPAWSPYLDALANLTASSSTIKGSFPPNSKKTRLSVFAPISASETPTSVLPVREIAFTLGLFARIFPINSPEPVMICSTLPGIPCSIQRAIIFINVRGGACGLYNYGVSCSESVHAFSVNYHLHKLSVCFLCKNRKESILILILCSYTELS